jgi:flavin reductase (DIM6/NTAB) family NADH-FMN oxidoreductase RutF
MLMPAAPIPPVIDPRELRRALGRFATGICIVTTRDIDGIRQGLTINSFASVSLDPPLVLWCLDRDSQSAEAFAGASHFNIGVLRAGQEMVSRCFSSRLPDKFLDADGFMGEDARGLPIVRDALAHFACRRTQLVDAGDHLILIGAVETFTYAAEPGDLPLIYHGGRYRRLDDRAD